MQLYEAHRFRHRLDARHSNLFSDSDGHSLEYITLLNDAPDLTFFGTWSEWQEKTNVRNTNK